MKEIKRDKWFFVDKVTFEKTTHTWDSEKTEQIEAYDYHVGRISVVAIALLLIIITVIIAPDFIGAGQVGIVTRFGEVNRVAESGLNFHIPLIESVTKMDTRTQKAIAKVGAASKDLQDVTGEVAVNYSVTNESALKIYKELGKDYVETVLTPAISEAFKQATSKYTAEGVITNRAELKEAIVTDLKARMGNYGIAIVDINITDLNFSKEFNAAIEQKAVAQQEVERARQELERVKVEAESKIEAARAEAEAQRLQQQTLTDAMIKKMWIEKWDGKLPTTATGDNGVMLNLGQ